MESSAADTRASQGRRPDYNGMAGIIATQRPASFPIGEQCSREQTRGPHGKAEETVGLQINA